MVKKQDVLDLIAKTNTDVTAIRDERDAFRKERDDAVAARDAAAAALTQEQAKGVDLAAHLATALAAIADAENFVDDSIAAGVQGIDDIAKPAQ